MRSTLRKRIALASVLALVTISLSACVDFVGPGYQRDSRDLTRNERLWRDFGPFDYDYVVVYDCFCGFAGTPVRVFVRNNQVVDEVYENSGLPVTSGYNVFNRTVEDLFDVVRDGVDRRADEIRASYDGYYGYPRTVQIDYDFHAADEEFGFRLLSFIDRS
jgi:hypothetical protein